MDYKALLELVKDGKETGLKYEDTYAVFSSRVSAARALEAYRGDLQSARAIVKDQLPGATWAVGHGLTEAWAMVYVHDGKTVKTYEGRHTAPVGDHNVARALLIAVLEAKA